MTRKNFLSAIFLLVLGCLSEKEYAPMNGDIIFQTSRSSQSIAVQRVTHSPYSHMGIVYMQKGKPFVFEAVGPVKTTPLQEWIDRGEGGRYVVKRLKDSKKLLTQAALKQMLEVGREFEGKPYDLYFEWSDERLYCSELVWKIYQRALGIEIGDRQKIKEFDLSDPLVQAKVKERYGSSIPKDEPVISPAKIFACKKLEIVHEQ